MSVQKKIKKGNSSWKPSSVTDVVGKEPGYRYRWVNKDPDNMAKKEAEGWETVNGLQADQVAPTDSNRVHEGNKMTSVIEKRDVILQRIPEELAQERDAYFNNESARRISGLTAHIKKDLGNTGAAMHGEITISSRKGTQVIE